MKILNRATHQLTVLVAFALFSQNLIAADSSKESDKGVEKTASVIWDASCDDMDEEAGFLVTLIGILAPKVVDFALGHLGDRLAETSEEFRVSHTGKAAATWATVQFSESAPAEGNSSPKVNANISLDSSCVIVHSGSAGRWGEDDRGKKADLTAEEEKAFYPGQVRNFSKRPALFLMAEIDYMQVGDRGLVFRVVPLKFALNGYTSRGRASKDIIATIGFSVPSIVVKGGFKVDAVFPPITDVSAGDRMAFTNLTTDWIPFPTLTGKAGEKFPVPASVQVTVLETDNGAGAKLFSSLSDAIEKNQKELNKAIIDSLSGDSSEEET